MDRRTTADHLAAQNAMRAVGLHAYDRHHGLMGPLDVGMRAVDVIDDAQRVEVVEDLVAPGAEGSVDARFDASGGRSTLNVTVSTSASSAVMTVEPS
jgi:hypothetical protein